MIIHELERKLRATIQEETEIVAKKDWIRTQQECGVPLFNYRFNHVQEVVRIAKILANNVGANRDIVTVASWLHDISKPGREGPSEHGIVSADIAQQLLQEEGLEPEFIERVCDAIVKHVGLMLDEPLTPIESQIVWEADKMTKLGASGLLHFIIMELQYSPGKSSVQFASEIHVQLKLAEGIADSMNTPLAIEMAKVRLQNMIDISQMLDSELMNE